MKHRLVRLSAAVALAAAGVGALVTAPSTPALGFVSGGLILEVTIDSPATLVARGAALDVPVTVLCTADFAFLDVQVTERVGSSIAQGFGGTDVGCTGSNQTIIVRVTAQSGKAFKRGTADAEADLFGCGFGDCGQETDSRVIKIVKGPH